MDSDKLMSWSDYQEEYHLRPAKLNWSTKQVKAHGDYFFNLITNETDIKTGDDILFLGCNDGGHVEQFVKKGYDAYGCDLPGLIKRAKKLKPNIANRLYKVNLENAVPGWHEWKLVVVKAVIEHLVYWFRLPDLIAEVQPSGGMVWVCTKDGNIEPWPEEHHFHHITFGVLEQIFIDAGYTILKHYNPKNYPHGFSEQILVGRKK